MRWQGYSAVGLMVFGALVWLFSALPAQAGAPTKQLKSTIEQAIAVLDDQALDDAGKYDRLIKIIEPRFDFSVISQRVLARHWRENPDRAQEFVPLFKELLERTYIKQVWLKEARGARVAFLKELVEGNTATVDTILTTAKGEEHPISYRLQVSSAQWKIVDIRVLNMSLVNTYRSRYDAQRSFDDLLEYIRKKIAKAESRR